jgi:hypothetical protein
MAFASGNPKKAAAAVIALAVSGVAVSEPVLAHGSRGGFRAGVVVRATPARVVPHARFGYAAPRARIFIAAPLIAAPLYYHYRPPVYYAPPVAVVPASPPQYIEQPRAETSSQDYWYWCSEANAYYPYVKECPGGWRPVVPQPAPS